MGIRKNHPSTPLRVKFRLMLSGVEAFHPNLLSGYFIFYNLISTVPTKFCQLDGVFLIICMLNKFHKLGERMCLKSCFFILISLFYISTSWSQLKNSREVKFDLKSAKNTVPKVELQKFKVTMSDSWFGKDKADHFLASVFLTAGSFYYLKEEQNISQGKSMNLSIAFAFSLGIAKEIRDGSLKGRAASVKDVVADILGIGIGAFLFNIEK